MKTISTEVEELVERLGSATRVAQAVDNFGDANVVAWMRGDSQPNAEQSARLFVLRETVDMVQHRYGLEEMRMWSLTVLPDINLTPIDLIQRDMFDKAKQSAQLFVPKK